MTSFIEIVPSTQGLLPEPCDSCVWWQSSHRPGLGCGSREEWLQRVSRRFGSVGVVAAEAGSTFAALQFAPAGSLARLSSLPGGHVVPEDGVLVYCLRAAEGTEAYEVRRLLHRALGILRRRDACSVYAFAQPLGSAHTVASHNVWGLEFLAANGFHSVSSHGDMCVMTCQLHGLLPSRLLPTASWLRVRSPAAAPTPVAFSRLRGG
jgi:hypothetical protein